MAERAPALRGWAVRRWCERLAAPHFALAREADALAALLEVGSSATLARQLAADVLCRCDGALPRLRDALRAARLGPIAKLALVHALLTPSPLSSASGSLSSASGRAQPLLPDGGLLEAVLQDPRGDDDDARGPPPTPRESAANGGGVLAELKRAVRACDALALLSSEGGGPGASLLLTLLDDGTAPSAQAGAPTAAGPAALAERAPTVDDPASPKHRGAGAVFRALELSGDLLRDPAALGRQRPRTSGATAAAKRTQADDEVLAERCAAAVCACAWHWPRAEATGDDDKEVVQGFGNADGCAPHSGPAPLSERALTRLLQLLLARGEVLRRACLLCAARSIGTLLGSAGTPPTRLVRAGLMLVATSSEPNGASTANGDVASHVPPTELATLL
eukprot:2135509-Prymnesium_polylepis.1